jgi:hypothetical protein
MRNARISALMIVFGDAPAASLSSTVQALSGDSAIGE